MSSSDQTMQTLTPATLWLDLGSSRCKWLLQTADEPVTKAATLHTGDMNELQQDLQRQQASGLLSGTAIGISVAHEDQRSKLSAMLQSEFAISVHWLRSQAMAGDLHCGYPQTVQLGVDRWAGLAGARALYPDEHVIIMDYGTATTVDFLAADGRHLGGWISPGLRDSLRLLLRRLAHPPALADADEDALLQLTAADASYGTDTRTALAAGVVHAQAGIIAQARLLAARADWPACRVIVTGGDAQYLLPLLDKAVTWQPLLLFIGMQWLQQQTLDRNHDT